MSEQVAVVVGAGGSIGGACAAALAVGRDRVLCVDLSGDRAERTAAAIVRAGGRAEVVVADAAAADFADTVTAAVPGGATVTAVVHAVAYEEHIPSDKATRESLERSFAVGPLAAFTLFRGLRATGHLRRGSALTAVGSLHATHPFANCLAYNAAHGALAQVVRTLAHEWAADGIRVNAVVPGWIRTDAEVAFYGEAHLDRVAGSLPLGRFGTGEDIAQAVAYLCSEQAAYVSGSFLTVDGALGVSLARLTGGNENEGSQQ
jgi:NAD(P)-dependent dehydrogenase (short-subunit alcohol dehydrogenase family)